MNSQVPPRGNAGAQRVPRIPEDRYALLGVLGVGGMGTVLKAQHVGLNKLVAIKVLNLELLGDGTSLKRFETEAKAGGQLSHPNLVAVFDFGYTVDGEPFFVMEYVEGFGLSELVKRCGKCSNSDFLFIFGQVLKALNYIHKKNVIHRDIKGSNIMLQFIEGDRYVKLLDFGIAKVLADSGITLQQITATGEAVGSPLYMSPEACRGNLIDVRADIYSLGCVMYECFAGYPPFRGVNAMQTIQMHVNDAPPSLSSLCRSEQELAIASLIHKCILKNPDDRFQSVAELAYHMDEIVNAGAQMQALTRPVQSAPASNTVNRWKKGKTGEFNAVAPEQLQHTQPSSLSQTFRRATGSSPMPQAGQQQQPQQESEQVGAPVADRWHFHNVAGQQCMSNGNHFEAHNHFVKAVELAEQLGSGDERLPQSLNRLANCLKTQGKYVEAEQHLLRSLQIHESIVGPVSRELLWVLEHYTNLLRIMKRDAEAEKLNKRMQAIAKGGK
jgi:serine/threonine protein kinase